ncbi:MAG: hypothetical protein U5L75_00215 [Candidatus Campbellbacteria bacterium]|nr:hypothetical protein [Candidatus Campbellbacteria bacterium]
MRNAKKVKLLQLPVRGRTDEEKRTWMNAREHKRKEGFSERDACRHADLTLQAIREINRAGALVRLTR